MIAKHVFRIFVLNNKKNVLKYSFQIEPHFIFILFVGERKTVLKNSCQT